MLSNKTIGNIKTIFIQKVFTDEFFKTVGENNSALEIMYKVGEQALLNLPQTFNGEIFKAEVNDTPPMPFFPQLKQHADKIDLLVKFCIKYAENLDQTEVDQPQTQGTSTPFSNTSMQVLGGFIAVIGAAAVAVAFVALNAATLGLAGLIVAGSGSAAILGGVGLFAAGTYKKCQSTSDVVLDDSLASVPM